VPPTPESSAERLKAGCGMASAPARLRLQWAAMSASERSVATSNLSEKI